MLDNIKSHSPLAVFGAQVVENGPVSIICGGVGQAAVSQGQMMTFASLSHDKAIVVHATASNVEQWPFMIGSSVLSVNGSLVVFGGGATCFSMGTFWETGIYSAEIPHRFLRASAQAPSSSTPISLKYLESPQLINSGEGIHQPDHRAAKATLTTIPRVTLKTERDFQEVLRDRKPVIIEGLSFGACLEKWTPDYMAERLGPTKEVSSMNYPAT